MLWEFLHLGTLTLNDLAFSVDREQRRATGSGASRTMNWCWSTTASHLSRRRSTFCTHSSCSPSGSAPVSPAAPNRHLRSATASVCRYWSFSLTLFTAISYTYRLIVRVFCTSIWSIKSFTCRGNAGRAARSRRAIVAHGADGRIRARTPRGRLGQSRGKSRAAFAQVRVSYMDTHKLTCTRMCSSLQEMQWIQVHLE